MFHAVADDGAHMLVRQGVKYRLPFPPELYKIRRFKHPQLMGYGALAHAQQLGHIAYAKLSLHEQLQ